MTRFFTLGLLLVSLFVFTSCGDDDTSDGGPDLTTSITGSYDGTVAIGSGGSFATDEDRTATVTKVDNNTIRVALTSPLVGPLQFEADMLTETTFSSTGSFSIGDDTYDASGLVSGDIFTFTAESSSTTGLRVTFVTE